MRSEVKEDETEIDTAQAYAQARERYGATFDRYISEGNVDGAHIEWNKIAAATSLLFQGKTIEKAQDRIDKNWQRGSVPKFAAQNRTMPIDRHGSPTQHRQRELTNLRNQINDLKVKTRHAKADWFTPANVLSTGPSSPVEAIGGAENVDTEDTREMADQVLR